MSEIMEQDINRKFDEKIKDLEKTLPKMTNGANCAELTLTSVLEVLGIKNGVINNLIIPLAGGFGGYKSKKGWQGACGAVCGGCAATGVILGGRERMPNELILNAYMNAAKFAADFEAEFGTVVCSGLCGYDFSDPDGLEEYQKNNTWETTCNKFVLWAVDHVRTMMRDELTEKW
ncbi:MAG: C_GCAxxG_C_C family protein [Candidatus Lokiarchaeota archaeon]|nr:C_GCAxxG_C_C family protein [Candidatus Lokiarchaeota archaeon]